MYLGSQRLDNHRYHRGQALVPVIFVLLILTVVAVAFTLSARRELQAAANFSNEVQSFYAARGAVNYAMSALAKTSNNGATYGVVQPSADTDAAGWQPVGDAWVKTEVIDTGAGINLNTVDSATLQRIPVFRNDPQLVAAILDWRSQGDQPSQNGAKSEYYSALPTPYRSKNAPYDTVEELLLVRGMTPARLYGNGAGAPVASGGTAQGSSMSVNGMASATRQAPSQPGGGTGQSGGTTGGTQSGGTGSDNGDSSSDTALDNYFNDSTLPLANLFTTVSRERNVAADGSARVNLNTATAQDLQDKLGISAGQARRLINFRDNPNQGNGGNQGGGAPGGGNPGGGPRPGGGNPRPRPGNGGNPRPRPGNGGNRPRPGGGFPRPGGGFGGGVGGGGGFFSRQAPSGNNTGGGQNQGGQGGGGGNGASGGSPTGNGQRQVFKSLADVLESGVLSRSVLQSVADKIATDDSKIRENVININTAPPEVLATVPGMDSTILQAILNYRQTNGSFQTIGDFFAIQDLQREQFQKVIANLCTKTSFYQVRVKVRVAGRSSVYAAQALVELTEYGPRIMQWREVARMPGWATWPTTPKLPMPANAGSAPSGDNQ